MTKKVKRITLFILVGVSSLAILVNGIFFSEKEPYIVREAQELKTILKKALGLPEVVEASSKVPRIAFIDQVISHERIEQLPSYQIDQHSYDTLDYQEHIIPGATREKDSFVFFRKKENQNHCEWMVKGFLAIAGNGNYEIYLPSNSPLPVDNEFVIPYPQWQKIIKQMDKKKSFDIVNCSYSYGKGIYPHESYEAVKRGALVIVSAGNEYTSDKTAYKENYTMLYKLAHELNTQDFKGAILIVGAYDPFHRTLISYSNRPFKDNPLSAKYFVSAPCVYLEGNKAYMNGGTSIAAAYTSGVAALLMKKFPNATAKEIASMIKKGSRGSYSLVHYESSAKIGDRMKPTENYALTLQQENLHRRIFSN